MIKRDLYLNRLISKRKNGLVKIITGFRRCGKSYLLFNIFKDYLNSAGVDGDHIISIALTHFDVGSQMKSIEHPPDLLSSPVPLEVLSSSALISG